MDTRSDRMFSLFGRYLSFLRLDLGYYLLLKSIEWRMSRKLHTSLKYINEVIYFIA